LHPLPPHHLQSSWGQRDIYIEREVEREKERERVSERERARTRESERERVRSASLASSPPHKLRGGAGSLRRKEWIKKIKKKITIVTILSF